VANYATLVKAQVADLEVANRVLAARKKRPKRKIQKQGSLAHAAGKDLIIQNVINSEIEHLMQLTRPQEDGAVRRQYCCSGCGELGHRINQCSRR
jgi:hypothetical protein